MKKRFLVCIVLVIALMTALLASCGGSGGKKVESGKEATKEQIEDAKVKVEKLIEVENAARNLSATSEAAGKKSNMHWQGKIGTTMEMEQDGLGMKMDYYITSDEIIDFSTPGALKAISNMGFENTYTCGSFSDEIKAMIAEAEAQGIEPPFYEGMEYGVKTTLILYVDTETGKMYLNYHSSGSVDPTVEPPETSQKIWADFSAVSEETYTRIMSAIGSQLSLEEILNAIVGENNRLFVYPNGNVKVEKAVDDSYFKDVIYELDFIDDNNYKAAKTFTLDEPESGLEIGGELSITPTEEKVTAVPSDYETYEEVSVRVFAEKLQTYLQEFSI